MRRIITKNWLRLSLIFLVSFSVSLTVASAARTIIFPAQHSDATDVESNESEVIALDNSTKVPEFQTTIDSWVAELPADTKIGIAIYDLDSTIPVASSNANTLFSSPNFYRWLLSYDGYHEIALENSSAGEFLTSDYYAEYSLENCLEMNLADTNQACTKALSEDQARQARISTLLSEHGLVQTDLSTQSTTAYELGQFLQSAWSGADIEEAYLESLHSAIENQNISDGFTILKTKDNKTYLIVALSEKVDELKSSLEMLFELLKNTALVG